ncbi:hypothetical protein HYDPIDRAFT_112805 [Hydnomerulius pinastri MD-312]|uniref:Uncharacterized protein n=1 Tax=Hydnomerulius pinastri MD-312 TaxID=994086 RepID=A0A0C9WF21_9AGAM|nr:hypothetical protein HYDPIDRAFT_112805 [Hydnomerulius pinastri MD-312]
MTLFTFTFTPVSVLPITTASTTDRFSSPTSTSTSSYWPPTSSSPLMTRTTSTLTSTFTSATTSISSQDTTSPTPAPTTVFIQTTVLTTFTLPASSHSQSPYTSTYTLTSVLPGHQGTTTYFATSSGALSTVGADGAIGGNISQSPGSIAGLVLGIVGAFAFAALWLFCARRRHRKIERDDALIAPEHQGPGPLDGEVFDGDELGYGIGSVYGNGGAASTGGLMMEERYAGILAALHAGGDMGAGLEGGSTGGVYGSHRGRATNVNGDMDDELARSSSPTLPLYAMPPEDPPYAFPLSPPPPMATAPHHQMSQPAPPPSAYFSASRRRSSPGPDASAWFGGYSIAPSCNSHYDYAHSQTMGSGSGSGSVDALTRTHTGSEEPLLGIGRVSEMSHGAPGGLNVTGAGPGAGGNRLGLGSAFGSPEGSMYSPSTSAVYPGLRGDTTGSYDARSASGSGSYGYTRSGTPSSFDVLRSVSSQGALSSAYSHGHGQNQGFRFGFGGPGSASSGSTGKRGRYRHSFGNPPTSFRAWKEKSSGGSEKSKEKDWRRSSGSSTSALASGSADEKQGRTSPVLGVRAFLGRLRRAGNTPSPRSSTRELASPPPRATASPDVDLEKATGVSDAGRVTPPPPPIQIHIVTPQRAQYSFVLSNPDPHPPSPYSGTKDAPQATGTPPHEGDLYNPHEAPMYSHPEAMYPSPSAGGLHPQATLTSGYTYPVSIPSPVPTEELRLEGLLHPRLRVEGNSDRSLRDFEDYSRPIGGLVNNRMYSTTTFGTVDDNETGRDTPSHEQVDVFGATPGVPRESWFVDDDIPRSPGLTT